VEEEDTEEDDEEVLAMIVSSWSWSLLYWIKSGVL